MYDPQSTYKPGEVVTFRGQRFVALCNVPAYIYPPHATCWRKREEERPRYVEPDRSVTLPDDDPPSRSPDPEPEPEPDPEPTPAPDFDAGCGDSGGGGASGDY